MLIVLIILLILAVAILIFSYVCYKMAFSVPKEGSAALKLLDIEQYLPYKTKIEGAMNEARSRPYEPATTTSQDGTELFARQYFNTTDSPWIIMFHGYRSIAELDFGSGLKFAIEQGFNVLLVDQRAHGKSKGRCLTFGVKEKYDCLAWINYVLSKQSDAKIILYGISMGAATVLMATGLNLPTNVKGVVSDCGYDDPSRMIKKTIIGMHFPIFPSYAILRLGGMIFGGFDIDSDSPAKAMQNCDIPVLFIHGDADSNVPCEMSQINYNNCRSPEKELLIVKGAEHGISFMVDKKSYLSAVTAFIDKVLNPLDTATKG